MDFGTALASMPSIKGCSGFDDTESKYVGGSYVLTYDKYGFKA